MSQLRQAVEQVFVGNSEMARLMRARFACAEGNADWSQTPLGSVETWSQSLRTSISICLSSRSPILLWWGTDLVMFYNDACRPLLGITHPKAMGQGGRDGWANGWDAIGPTLEEVLLTGEGTWSENQQLLLDRFGYLEECYFTFSYSPIADETGGTGGVFTTVTETTRQVISERRLQTLRDLSADTAKAKTLEETYRAAIAILANNPNCIPFALLYRIESDEQAHLVETTGLKAGTTASASAIKFSQAQAWPFEQVKATGQSQRVEDLRTRFGQLFDKDGTPIANDALILPLTQIGGRQRVIGFLVLGISPKLAFDPDYQSFFELVARSVEVAIANARSYEAERQQAEALAEGDRTETTLFNNVNHEFRALRLEAESVKQKAETILSSISDGVYTFDRDWRYTYVNDRLCQMAGKSREELLGYCIWEVFPEAVDTDVYVHFHKAMREQLPCEFEVFYSPWNRWFEHRLYPDPDGLTIFSAEVTARKQAELVLVEQKRLLELIALNHSLDECLSALCNAVSRLNPRARACILLADAHQLTFPRSITPGFPPSFGQGLKDAPINELCIGTCGEAVYSGQPVTCADIANDDRWSQEWRELCISHGILSCHSVPVLDSENQPLGSLMLCFDEPRMPTDWEYQIATFGTQIASIVFERDRAIAALRQRDDQLRLAADAAHLGLWHWDVQSDTLTWTDQCKALFGLPTHTEMSYDVFLNAIHPDDRQRVQEMRPVLEDGQLERHEIEYRTLWPDGTVRWLMVRGSVTYDADSKPVFSRGVIFDITDRKRAEIAVCEGEDRLKLAMEAGRMVAWEWNPFDDRLITSTNFSEIYGANNIQTAERAITLLHPEDRSRHQATVAQAVETRSVYRSEFRIVRPDTGAIVWLEERGQPILNEDDSLQKLIGVAIDISDRKRAEAALRESEERFRVLADCAPSLIWLNGADGGGCEFVNQAYLDFFGKTLEEIQGFGWQVDLHPDDAEEYVSAYLKAFRECNPFQAKVRVRRADGQYRWLDCYAAPRFSNSGALLGYVGTSFDITDRRQTEEALRESEERFRTLAATVPQLLWTATPHGSVDYLSEQWADYIGLSPERLYDWNWQQVVHPDDLPNTLHDWQHSIQSGESLEIQHRFRHHTGEWRWQLVRSIPVKDETGQVTKWVGTCTDIHDSELRQQDAQFLSNLSEAIRTIDHADRLMTAAIEMIGQYLQLKRCYFAQTDEANDRAWIASDYHDSLPSLVGEHPLSHYPSVVLELLRSGQLYISHDNKRDPRSVDCYETVYEPLAIRAHVVVPFFADGRWAVNLIAATNEPRQWQEREIKLLETVAERIWLAVEKLRSQVALRESEDRYRALTELSPQLVFMSQPDGFITYVNQWGLDFTGRSLSEFQGSGWAEFVHPDHCDRVYNAWMTATSNVSNYEIEIPYLRVDGMYRWLFTRALPVTNDAGEIEYWIGVAIDITDRKSAEAALHESEERLRLAMEAAQMGSWDLNISTGELIWSEQYFKVLGYEPVANGAASYEMWSSRVHPDDREWVLRRWQQSRLEQQLYRAEYRVIRADNAETAWIASLGSFIYDETGEPIRALGVVFDISDRKQKDAALQESLAILNTVNEVTPTLIYIKDRQRRLQMVNPATARLLGKSEAELIGKTEVDYLKPEEAKQIAENDCRVMESGQVIIFEELVVVPEGNRIFLSAKAPYRDEQGNIIGLIGVSTDISDRKQAEAEREQLLAREQFAREEAERANRIKDEFLAVLSHELRSPLNPILGWSRLLLNGNLDGVRTRQALTTIERNAKLQAELIEDLLDVSRILQGKLSLTISPVNLAATIKAAIETVRLAAEVKSIVIETNLDLNVGLVTGDATRLQQVMWNLLSNAVKFTPEGGHAIVQLEQVDRQARITVSDSGKGIVPDFLPYVFDYFRQADSATTRKFGGLGLGLAIVRHLVELHGGTIQADSPGEGFGATFTVYLPLIQTPPKIEPRSQSPQQSLTLQGIHVFVVDDDTDTRDFIEFLLQQSGAMVTTAASAKEALTALRHCQPDVLLSDIGMPDMDGYMLMQRFRASPQGGQIPAIALTAYAGEYDRQQALSVGFQQHLPKPVEPEKLVEIIVSLLNRAD